jgi:hypothetical protein
VTFHDLFLSSFNDLIVSLARSSTAKASRLIKHRYGGMVRLFGMGSDFSEQNRCKHKSDYKCKFIELHFLSPFRIATSSTQLRTHFLLPSRSPVS